MFTITDKAAKKITSLIETDKKDCDIYGLRVGIQGGGCSGFKYLMYFDQESEGDKVYVNGDAKVFVDPNSLSFIEGSVLEYADTLTQAGFNVTNPNASSSCGCGESFSV
jgi:iron-sulfur cluster assembly protein